MWRRTSRKPLGLVFSQGIRIVAMLYMVAITCLVLHAQTDSAPAPRATPAAPQADTIPSETTSSTYRLQPYDLIDVDVYGEDDLHKPARLGADGTVLLPLIGSVKVGGLTVTEATDLITKGYANGFVKNPSVLITVLQYRKSTFSIIGQVMRPGNYEIPEGSQISIIEAVSLASGFSPTAAQNAVTVKRTVDGQATTFKVRVGDMAQNANAEPFEILPGDMILVPASQFQKNSFSMLGQISRPGVYEIPEGAHVNIIDAISLAGGFAPMAAQNSISVKRVVDGKLTILKVRAADMVQDPNLVPFEIEPGDSILVPYTTSTFSILGQVGKPGIYEIPEGTHLNIIDAILMAGGFAKGAAENAVLVKRMVNGKPTSIKVKAAEMAEDPDMLPFEVLPGDIIKVNESWY